MLKNLVAIVMATVVSSVATDVCEKEIFVDTLDLSHATCGFGKRVTPHMAVDGKSLSVSGKVSKRGFGAHPESAVAFSANGKVITFDALVGVADSSGKSWGVPAVRFRIWADGKILYDSRDLKLGQQPAKAHADLSGAEEIVLETTGGGPWSSYDKAHGVWIDARFACKDGVELEPIKDPGRIAQLGILTPPDKKAPQINGADIWGVRPGHPVIFRVATSGERPIDFSAKGLPEGVDLDTNGVLRGNAPGRPGNYDISVTAKNAHGKAERTIRLAVGETLALTPPMGWNSWNCLCFRICAENVKEQAKAMDASGLADHGWSYINLDDWWAMNNSGASRTNLRKEYFGGREDVIGPERDANGKILPNRGFPDMKDLTDYIHSLGFKAGIYSSPGPLTCGKCTGSYGHELQDAESWAEWGFDYLKYDRCSYGPIFQKENGVGDRNPKMQEDASRREAYMKPYRLMAECLRAQKRDIVLHLCQYGLGHTETWGDKIGGSCWRIWDDLHDSWSWMERAIEGWIGAGEFHKYNKPGWWADPDMMIIGMQHSFSGDHPTYLSPNEQYTHVSLWAMVGAPLLLGCDMTNLDAFTRSLLVNDMVIAVNQDRLGRTARRIRHLDAESVWARPLSDGSVAVALVNRYPLSREIAIDFKDVGIVGECWVRNLWTQKCEGKHTGFYVAAVPPHATILVKVRSSDCQKCD